MARKNLVHQTGSDIFKSIEKMSTIMKLGIAGVSIWLLYRKYERDQLEDELLRQKIAEARQPVREIAYQAATPDQVAATVPAGGLGEVKLSLLNCRN